MPVTLSSSTKIYVTTPANVATGGAEDMHQLAYDLKEMFPVAKVYMHYSPEGAENPVPKEYEYFNLEFAHTVEDNEENVLILHEGYTTRFNHLRNIKVVLWWLSVDHYFTSQDFAMQAPWAGKINTLLWKLGIQHYVGFEKRLRDIRWHGYQSRYVCKHLQKHKVRNTIVPLMDHVNPSFVAHVIDESIKEDIVAYNPKKGLRATKRIIRGCPGIRFVPIERMSKEDVIDLLKRAKVYIDFGYHPGGDRFPKEAALLGCLVITGKRGTAGYFDDVPIPPDYKISQLLPWTPRLVHRKIRYGFANYHVELRRFIPFRERARKDRDTHLADMRDLFVFEQ
jgi:hypothetical protein